MREGKGPVRPYTVESKIAWKIGWGVLNELFH